MQGGGCPVHKCGLFFLAAGCVSHMLDQVPCQKFLKQLSSYGSICYDPPRPELVRTKSRMFEDSSLL
jgi:hypothetical protein